MDFALDFVDVDTINSQLSLPTNADLKDFAVVQKFVLVSPSERSSMSVLKIRLMFRCVSMSINVNECNLRKVVINDIFSTRRIYWSMLLGNSSQDGIGYEMVSSHGQRDAFGLHQTVVKLRDAISGFPDFFGERK